MDNDKRRWRERANSEPNRLEPTEPIVEDLGAHALLGDSIWGEQYSTNLFAS
jgi:hypothetical protein